MVGKKYVAALLGGSGSVGKYVLKSILADPNCERVILISRRELNDLKALDTERIAVQVCDPLDDLATKADLKGTHVAFCTLGHGSSRKSTRNDLLRVDATIPGEFARICKDAGVTHYCLMTAVGSDENAQWSPITKTAAGGGWYNHVKGVAERLTLEAKIPYTYIARPSTLIGSPHTPNILTFIPNFILPAVYSSARIADIARGMVKTTTDAFQMGDFGVATATGGVPISEGKTD